MNKKISQFDLTTSLGDNDLITLIQDGENKNITKATLEHELADTFVADSELEDQITNLTNNLDALEKKHDEAIDDITDVVQDWTDEISTRPTAEQLQDVLNRVIISENKITKLAEAITSGAGGNSGNSGRGIISVVGYYARGGSSTPSASDFSTSVPELTTSYPNLWSYAIINYTDGTTNGATYKDAVIIGARGSDGISITGPQGADGPSMNFRGVYDSNATYYRTQTRVDVVKHDNNYYMVYPGRNEFFDKSPSLYSVTENTTSSNAYWIVMPSFEMFATGLLLAEEATIAGWVFKPSGYLVSQNNMVCLNGNPSNGEATISIGKYKNGWTGTTINDDADLVIFQSGIIQLGNGTCGISGLSDSPVNGGYTRFWAGAGRNDGENNSFYVTDAGYLYANNAEIKGKLECDTLTVSNYANWGGPGLKAICYISNNQTGKDAANTATLIYSVGGVTISSATADIVSTGHRRFYVSGLSSSDYIIITGSDSSTDAEGMRATYGVYSKSKSSFYIHSIDTDNDNHNLHGVYVAILSY